MKTMFGVGVTGLRKLSLRHETETTINQQNPGDSTQFGGDFETDWTTADE